MSSNAYAVDIVTKTLGDLSKSPVHVFQRDGIFFAASREGFGFLTLGLPIYDICASEARADNFAKEVFTNSADMLAPISKEDRARKFVSNDLAKRVRPLLFGGDEMNFSLEGLAKTAEAFDALPEKEEVFLVGHSSGYHSHKYGYACDGIDVWLAAGRTMKKDKFFEFMRRREDAVVEELGKYPESTKQAYAQSGCQHSGQRFRLPNLGVLTPSLLVHLPRPAVIDHHNPDKLWTSRTEFSVSELSNDFLDSNRVSYYQKSPFGISVVFNYLSADLTDPEKVSGTVLGYLDCQKANINALSMNLGSMREYIDRLNGVHNGVFKEEIKEHEKFLKGLEETHAKERADGVLF